MAGGADAQPAPPGAPAPGSAPAPARTAGRGSREYDLTHSVWFRLGDRFGLVAARPRLASDIRVRRIGEEIELVHLSSGRLIPLSEEDLRIVRQFDGKRTIAEIVVAELGVERRLAIQPVLSLLDRVVRAEMLDDFPPNFYSQLDNHLARMAVTRVREQTTGDDGEPVDMTAYLPAGGGGSLSQFEQVPWRPRTPLLAERAQFLRGIELLKPLDLWAIGALAEAAHEEAFPAASPMVRQGEPADRFYVIRSGDANVTKLDSEGNQRRIAKLGPGDTFGEAGLLEGAPRNASVRAGPSRPVQVYSFDRDVFEHLISPHIESFRGRQSLSKRRQRLGEMSLFSALEHADLDRLAHVVQEHTLPAGSTVVEQGEPGDRFYVIVDGKVAVERDGVHVADLGAGEFFGETALLFTAERTATVRTAEQTTLWSLDKVAFQRLVREHLLGRRDMMPTLLNRLHAQG